MIRVTVEDGDEYQVIVVPDRPAVVRALAALRQRIENEGGVMDEAVMEVSAHEFVVNLYTEEEAIAWADGYGKPPIIETFLVVAKDKRGAAPWSDIKMDEIADWLGFEVIEMVDRAKGQYRCALPFSVRWEVQCNGIAIIETDPLGASYLGGFWRLEITP